ncbi:MAG: hypothetical protein QOE56_1114 [Solirubrobacterales bacterium]|jgi:uncharacterized protein YjbI with pentapeptide repeats|nr:hypothetical protein [Solirubrobacterales bacterium]
MRAFRIRLDKRCICAGLVCLLVLAASTTAALGARSSHKTPTVKKISLLYALNARTGTLRPEKGKGAKYKLTLKGLDRNVTWFSDRPARRTGSFPISGLARSWKGFGFAANPPNAALTYSDKGGNPARTVIVEISHPRFAEGKLSFAARVLDPKTIKQPNLADHAAAADRDPARALTEASLFIDDTAAKLVVDCALQPFTRCEGVDLGPLNLYEADLWGANFSGSDLDGSHIIQNSRLGEAILVKTSLRNSVIQAGFEKANLDEADLTGTDLRNSYLEGAHLERTELVGANLSYVTMQQAWLGDANLTRANLEGVQASNGQWLDTNLSGANLERASLIGTVLENANLTGANLENANLGGVGLIFTNLENANLTGAELGGAYVSQANFCNAKMPDGTTGPCNGPINFVP